MGAKTMSIGRASETIPSAGLAGLPPLVAGPAELAITDAALAAGHALFAQPCLFALGVVAMTGLPAADRPEIAFAGRSNVGKSSLINALTGHKGLARTSNTPGRTRELNFFTIGTALHLVDMPGYGYAQVSKREVEGWNALIMAYLKGRTTLTRVFLLIDARHGIKANDRETMGVMDQAALIYQVVLTKADKLKRGELAATMTATQAIIGKHAAAFPQVLATSAEKGWGIAELRGVIAQLTGVVPDHVTHD